MVNVTLKGVKGVKKADLLSNIYTTASYCNSFILKPFCWISKSKYFYTRKYLDHDELRRDVLRIRVFYWKRGYREAEVDTAVVARGEIIRKSGCVIVNVSPSVVLIRNGRNGAACISFLSSTVTSGS